MLGSLGATIGMHYAVDSKPTRLKNAQYLVEFLIPHSHYTHFLLPHNNSFTLVRFCKIKAC